MKGGTTRKQKSLKRPKVLVLEDELPLRKIIHRKLEPLGFEVVLASTVYEAMHHLTATEGIVAIWMDHYLQGQLNGLDFVVQVKRNPLWREIPIFVVSNTSSTDKLDSYERLGVTHCFTKAETKLSDVVADITPFLREVQGRMV